MLGEPARRGGRENEGEYPELPVTYHGSARARGDSVDRGELPPRAAMRRAMPAAVPPQPVHRMMSVIGGASGVRFEIVIALAARPRDVGTLAADFELDQPTISHHLSELRKVGVVTAEVFDGHKVYSVGNGNGSVKVRREQGLVVVELTDADGGHVAIAQDRSLPAPSDDHASPAVQVVMNRLRQDRRA